MLPNGIQQYFEETLNEPVSSVKSVSGGSINRSVKISAGSTDYFLKWNHGAPDDFFDKESKGLKLLDSAGSDIRIPEVIVSEPPADDRPGLLLMEFIPEGQSGDSFRFGAELAKLHQTKSDQFGLTHDNYIGSLPQSNRRHDDWTSFFTRERINPQLKMAVDSGKMGAKTLKQWERLSASLDNLLPPVKPSLVHGDLWGGNYLFDNNGNAVLIDPAVYYGHPEMDLAFSKMFGGFSGSFYDGYRSIASLEPGFSDRVPIYNLYPLLVHVNLFGGHYASQAQGVLSRFG